MDRARRLPGDTSAGREPAGAVAKAAVVDRRLAGAAGPAAMAPLGRVFREYLAAGCSPYTGRPWRRSTRTQIADNLGRTLRGHEDVRALDLTRPDGHQSG